MSAQVSIELYETSTTAGCNQMASVKRNICQHLAVEFRKTNGIRDGDQSLNLW